ncbi:MAG: hypothetical protein J6Y19_06935, partial [Kiritimatiellae bacterium]|nr:hypothetical protein [Kiritimatiellia bacterium]
MKKWLVGLLAASLCVASAWAAGTASLPVAENYTGTQDWTALTGFSGSGVGSYGDGRCKFDSNNDWLMVQFDGTPGTLTFDIKGNSATSGTAPAKFLVEESADAETWSQLDNLDETKISSSEYTSFSYALASGTRYVRWTFANKYGFNFGLNNVAISSGGPAEFSVTFDKENWFTNVLGQANTITAIPANGIEPYTFLWESDTPELDGGTTDTLQIPDTLAEGDYTVACLVTEDNGEGDAINALIGFHVEAIPVITGGSATYTVVSKTSVEASGDVPTGSTAVYAADSTQIAQISSNKTAVLTLKGYEGMTITGLKLSMKSNKNAGSGSLRVTCGDALLASIEDSSFDTGWSTAFSTNYVDVVPEVTATTIDDDVVITIAGSVNSLYCQSYTVQFEAGEPGLGVTFDKANGFTVDLGTTNSITATAKNGVEPYTYAWTSDTPDLNGTGETLDIPATLAEGDYTVQVEVTDAESNKANNQIYFSVVAPAVKYDVIPTVGGNGVIVACPEQAAEGEDVSLVATANSGDKF